MSSSAFWLFTKVGEPLKAVMMAQVVELQPHIWKIYIEFLGFSLAQLQPLQAFRENQQIRALSLPVSQQNTCWAVQSNLRMEILECSLNTCPWWLGFPSDEQQRPDYHYYSQEMAGMELLVFHFPASEVSRHSSWGSRSEGGSQSDQFIFT